MVRLTVSSLSPPRSVMVVGSLGIRYLSRRRFFLVSRKTSEPSRKPLQTHRRPKCRRDFRVCTRKTLDLLVKTTGTARPALDASALHSRSRQPLVPPGFSGMHSDDDAGRALRPGCGRSGSARGRRGRRSSSLSRRRSRRAHALPSGIPIGYGIGYRPVGYRNPTKKAIRNSLLRMALRSRGDWI